MARFALSVSDDFIKQLGRLAEVDRIAPQMIDEALPILEMTFKKNLASVMEHPTGELMDSIKIKGAKPVKSGGFYGYVTATGVAKSKVYKRPQSGGRTKAEPYRNYQKILAIEFGTSKQNPKPFIAKTLSESETEVLNKMQEVYNREAVQ